MKIINSKQAPAPIGPYNQAIVANGFLFVSGQIPIDQNTGNIISDTIENETHQVMKNLQYILNEAGCNFNNVVKCSIFIKDMSCFTTINQIYGSYFTNHFPTRETIEVSQLPKNVNIEISCIALVP